MGEQEVKEPSKDSSLNLLDGPEILNTWNGIKIIQNFYHSQMAKASENRLRERYYFMSQIISINNSFIKLSGMYWKTYKEIKSI